MGRPPIFNPENVQNALECFGEDQEEREKYERVFQNKQLTPGASYPWLDGRETARKVAEHYRFPGWGIEGVESTIVQEKPPIDLPTSTESIAKPWWRFW